MTEMFTFATWISLNKVDFYAIGHYSGRWGSDPWLDRWSTTEWPHSTVSGHKHTHTLRREGPTGHETHQWRLSTSSHSNVTIKERSMGRPPTSKWCLSALTLLSLLFSFTPTSFFFFFYSFRIWLAMPCYNFFLTFITTTALLCLLFFLFQLTSRDLIHNWIMKEGKEILREWKCGSICMKWGIAVKKKEKKKGKTGVLNIKNHEEHFGLWYEGWGVIFLMHKDMIIAFMIEEEC